MVLLFAVDMYRSSCRIRLVLSCLDYVFTHMSDWFGVLVRQQLRLQQNHNSTYLTVGSRL